MSVSSAGFCLGAVIRLIQSYKNKSKLAYILVLLILTLLALFNIAWIIVGSVWFFTDDDCENGKAHIDYYDMWALTYAILIISYIAFGCCFCVLCCFYLVFKLCKKKYHEIQNSPRD